MGKGPFGCEVIDSFLDKEYPEHRVWAVTYEPYWQQVRRMCVFTSMNEMRASIARMEVYTHDDISEYEMQCRLFRAWNFMNSVPIGLHNPVTAISYHTREMDRTLTAYRRQLRERVQNAHKPQMWDWHETRIGLSRMMKTENGEKFLIDLYTRLVRWRARRPGKPELRHFLRMMEDAQ